jgi:hypothetical protein
MRYLFFWDVTLGYLSPDVLRQRSDLIFEPWRREGHALSKSQEPNTSETISHTKTTDILPTIAKPKNSIWIISFKCVLCWKVWSDRRPEWCARRMGQLIKNCLWSQCYIVLTDIPNSIRMIFAIINTGTAF